jgi:hypothetical protein
LEEGASRSFNLWPSLLQRVQWLLVFPLVVRGFQLSTVMESAGYGETGHFDSAVGTAFLRLRRGMSLYAFSYITQTQHVARQLMNVMGTCLFVL